METASMTSRGNSSRSPLMEAATDMTDEDRSEVHPIELTVQALLETPLETLNLNLKSLYESQMILHTILYKMECTLIETANNLRPGSFPLQDQVVPGVRGDHNDTGNGNGPNASCDSSSGTTSCNMDGEDDIGEEGIRIDHSDLDGELDLKQYLDRMERLRRKLRRIEKTIDEIEARVGRIENSMGMR